MSDCERLVLSIYISRHHRSECLNECDSFFTAFASNGFAVNRQEARLHHGIQSFKSGRIVRIASLQPVNFRKRCITPAWSMQLAEFRHRNASLINSTSANLITLFTRSHVFKHDGNVSCLFVPVGKVTVWFTNIEGVCNLVVELHFALVITKRDSCCAADGIRRCKFDHN